MVFDRSDLFFFRFLSFIGLCFWVFLGGVRVIVLIEVVIGCVSDRVGGFEVLLG